MGERVCLLPKGIYITDSPATENIKTSPATAAYIAGMIGFAIKKALGAKPPAA